MSNVTFITGNINKANYLSKYLGCKVDHVKLDLDEIQSINLKEIVEHKVLQAYDVVKKPVIVEDVSLEFSALGNLPGPFIKFFIEQVSPETICSMIPNGMTRKATARCIFGYFNGKNLHFFESSLDGEIAEVPSGKSGYGWDNIFIPKGYQTTRASLSKEDDQKTYLKIKPFEKLKHFLDGIKY